MSIAAGFSLKEVARQLCVSKNTADHHRTAAYAKLGIDDRMALARLVRGGGLTPGFVDGDGI